MPSRVSAIRELLRRGSGENGELVLFVRPSTKTKCQIKDLELQSKKTLRCIPTNLYEVHLESRIVARAYHLYQIARN
jgi:hypothetical protein